MMENSQDREWDTAMQYVRIEQAVIPRYRASWYKAPFEQPDAVRRNEWFEAELKASNQEQFDGNLYEDSVLDEG